MIIIDTDVLLLAFAFHRDERQSDNDRFLQWVQNDKPATTIYNVMELLGHLSFNLNTQKTSRVAQMAGRCISIDDHLAQHE